MKGKLGLILAGVATALLLDPSNGRQRRARVRGWAAPLQQRITKLRTPTPDEIEERPEAEAPTILQSVQRVARRLQEPLGKTDGDEETTGGPQGHDAAAAPVPATPVPAEATPRGATAPAGAQPAVSLSHDATKTPNELAAELAPSQTVDPIPEGEPNDPTLVARVESELFHDPEIPKGQLNVDAVYGVVTLRGTVKDEGQAREILERTREIEGVRDVVDLMRHE